MTPDPSPAPERCPHCQSPKIERGWKGEFADYECGTEFQYGRTHDRMPACYEREIAALDHGAGLAEALVAELCALASEQQALALEADNRGQPEWTARYNEVRDAYLTAATMVKKALAGKGEGCLEIEEGITKEL